MTHYKTLNVDPQADFEVIAAAYRALVKIYCDDHEMMKRLNEAREVLCDEDRRAKYDKDHQKVKGKVVGEYRILDKIAEGGFGVTYRAEHVETSMPVCIKHANRISSEDEALLLNEAKAMWDLRHFGIPAVRGILRMPDGSVALVMSYVPGPTLAEIVKKHYSNGIDAEHVAWIVDRILNILKYLHYHGVIHGDVKPQNVIIQPEDHTVVLVDYGLSLVKPRRNTGAKGYTEYFAAPEQMEGKTPVPETDFYGLGMTMIFALGGDMEHVKVPGDTPDGMCGFLKSLIRRDPLSRPNWKDEIDDQFRDIREEDFGRRASGMKPLKLK